MNIIHNERAFCKRKGRGIFTIPRPFLYRRLFITELEYFLLADKLCGTCTGGGTVCSDLVKTVDTVKVILSVGYLLVEVGRHRHLKSIGLTCLDGSGEVIL